MRSPAHPSSNRRPTQSSGSLPWDLTCPPRGPPCSLQVLNLEGNCISDPDTVQYLASCAALPALSSLCYTYCSQIWCSIAWVLYEIK